MWTRWAELAGPKRNVVGNFNEEFKETFGKPILHLDAGAEGNILKSDWLKMFPSPRL